MLALYLYAMVGGFLIMIGALVVLFVATRKIVNGNAVTLQRRGVVPVPSLPRRAVERPRKPVGPILMAKRTRTLPRTPRASARPPGRQSRPGIIHTSLSSGCYRPFLPSSSLDAGNKPRPVPLAGQLFCARPDS
jgi:hypothetical protein